MIHDFFTSNEEKPSKAVKSVKIVIDFSNILFRTLYSDKHLNRAEDVSIDLMRHLALTSILDYIKKCRSEYVGFKCEIILALDGHSWRYDRFPHYKWSRKQKDPRDSPEKIKFSERIMEVFDLLCKEAIAHFPFSVIRAPRAEADDICAFFASLATETNQVVVVSGDKDIHQLAFGHVKALVPTNTGKKWLSFNTEEERDFYVFNKIAGGDGGDSIPNCLSANTVFTEKKRQKPLFESRIMKWWNGGCSKSFGSILSHEPAEVCERFFENQDLIDLRDCKFIPADVIDSIKAEYESTLPLIDNKSLNLYKYFAANGLTRHLSNISQFIG